MTFDNVGEKLETGKSRQITVTINVKETNPDATAVETEWENRNNF